MAGRPSEKGRAFGGVPTGLFPEIGRRSTAVGEKMINFAENPEANDRKGNS